MGCCDGADIAFPLKADIYYPIITQNTYGQPEKQWVFDRTIYCSASTVSSSRSIGREDINPSEFIQYENKLIARSKSDIRISSSDNQFAATNILISNIRDTSDKVIYFESAGPRAGKGTIYELATIDPFVGAFGIEFYKMVWRRTENQSVSE